MKRKRGEKREAQYPQYPPPAAMKQNKPPRREVWYPDLPGLGESWRGIALRLLFFLILFAILFAIAEHNRL